MKKRLKGRKGEDKQWRHCLQTRTSIPSTPVSSAPAIPNAPNHMGTADPIQGSGGVEGTSGCGPGDPVWLFSRDMGHVAFPFLIVSFLICEMGMNAIYLNTKVKVERNSVLSTKTGTLGAQELNDKRHHRDIPGGAVAKTPSSLRGRPESHPWLGN